MRRQSPIRVSEDGARKAAKRTHRPPIIASSLRRGERVALGEEVIANDLANRLRTTHEVRPRQRGLAEDEAGLREELRMSEFFKLVGEHTIGNWRPQSGGRVTGRGIEMHGLRSGRPQGPRSGGGRGWEIATPTAGGDGG